MTDIATVVICINNPTISDEPYNNVVTSLLQSFKDTLNVYLTIKISKVVRLRDKKFRFI